MSKRNRKQKSKIRTLDERKAFYKMAKNYGGEETEQKNNAQTLEGSDDIEKHIEYDSISEEVKKPSIRSQVSLGFKNNVKEIIITTVLIPIAWWFINWNISVNSDLKYLNRILEETRSQIKQLTDSNSEGYSSFVTKENLELKLELVERDFRALIPDTTQIEEKLKEIEKELEDIRNNY